MYIARKLELLFGGLLLVCVLALGGKAWIDSKRLDAVQESYQAASGDARAATVYVEAYKEVAEQRRKKDAQVESVLESNRVWADEPVPDDVADLLRHPTGTARAVP